MRRLAVLAALAARRARVGVAPAGATNECRGPPALRAGRRALGRRPDRTGGAAAAGPVPAHVPEGLRRRRARRGAHRPRDRPRLPRRARAAPSTPGSPRPATRSSSPRTSAAPRARRPSGPHVGCIPTAGGGQRTPTAAAAVFPPGKPTIRRVANVDAAIGRRPARRAGLRRGERLVGGTRRRLLHAGAAGRRARRERARPSRPCAAGASSSRFAGHGAARRARDRPGRGRLRGWQVSFGNPLLLLSLLALPLAVGIYLLAERRRMRYAMTFTNIDVLAGDRRRAARGAATSRGVLFLLALASLCVALARPHVKTLGPVGPGDRDPRHRRLRLDAGERRQADAARGRAGRGRARSSTTRRRACASR